MSSSLRALRYDIHYVEQGKLRRPSFVIAAWRNRYVLESNNLDVELPAQRLRIHAVNGWRRWFIEYENMLCVVSHSRAALE